MKALRSGYLVVMILGLTVVITYLATTTGLVRRGGNLLLTMVFAIGPVAIAGMLALHRRLAASCDGLLLKTGIVFLVIGFALFNLMLVVQQMVHIQFRQMIAAADPAAREALRSVFRGVNLVQLGIDVSVDISECQGMILVGVVMCDHREFGKKFGVLGMVSAGLLLAFNLSTFPYPPANAGLVDLGPITGLWWLAVIVRMTWLDWRDRRHQVT